MKITKINMDTYPRKKHFEYFRSLQNPYAGMTVNIDITNLLTEIKKRKLPFFLTVLYLAVDAANQIPELRQRLHEEGIIQYDRCEASYTVALEDETYGHCRLDFFQPFEKFLADARCRQSLAMKNPTIEDEEEIDSLYFVSSVPWISYTALFQPTPYPADSNPRITFGRYFCQENRVLLPLTLLVNHALADGRHIARFFEIFTENSKKMEILSGTELRDENAE